MLSMGGLDSGRVFVQVDLVGHGDNFTIRIVPAGWAHVVRTLQFTAIGALVWISCHERIMSAAHVPARPGNLVLLDSHVSTLVRLI